jgi:hypothetical protein
MDSPDDLEEQAWRELEKRKPPPSVDAVLAERGKRYGLFKNHAVISQTLKSIIFTSRNDLVLASDQREALEMIAHKIARIINGDPDYVDSWTDIAGYAQLVADRLQGHDR